MIYVGMGVTRVQHIVWHMLGKVVKYLFWVGYNIDPGLIREAGSKPTCPQHV